MASTTPANRSVCVECGTPLPLRAPEGLCPHCLLEAGVNILNEVDPPRPPTPLSPAASSIRSVTVETPSSDSGRPRYFGDYELLNEIARGGMGVVFRARQLSLNRIVAVKMLKFGAFTRDEFVTRFQAEAEAAANLHHPNIVAIHDCGECSGEHFYSMAFIEGKNLAEWIAGQPLDARRSAELILIVAAAVQHAHDRGILHRDLKPSNILLDHEDKPHVSDFGLARRIDDNSTLTLTGQALGSPNYMAPEQAAGARGQVGVRSDIWSLGAIFYYLLTARPPFAGPTVAETLRALQQDEPARPRLLNSAVPADLETICLKCLEKEPEKRYATAQELADDLARFLRNEPILARPITRVERAWRWCRRKPALASFIAATALLLPAVLISSPVAIYRINRERLRAEQHLYASDMNLVQQAVQEGELGRALQLLNKHRPTNDFGGASSASPTSLAARKKAKSGSRGTRPSETDLRGWEWRYLWKQCQGEERFILGEHTYGASAVGILADGKTVFSAGSDKSVRLWDFESRRQIGMLPHSAAITGAAASRDGRWLATASNKSTGGQTVLLWDLATQKAATLTTNFSLQNSSITFSPDSKWLAFATYFRGVVLWDVNASRQVTNLPSIHPSHEPVGVAFSPDSRTLAYNEDDYGAILLWDIASRSMIGRLHGHQDFVSALAFSPDGQTLASGSHDRTARLWNLAPGVRPSSGAATVVGQRAQELSRARNDAKLAAPEDGRTPLNLADWRERSQFTNHSGGFTSLAFSRDGRTLAMSGPGGAGRVIRLIDVKTGEEKAQLRGHLEDVTSLAFTPDGQTLLSASEDGTVRVWDVVPGAKEKSAHVFAPNSISIDWTTYGPALCLSPDGRHLLTVYTNQTFSLWDTLDFAEREHHPLPFTNTTMAAVAPGGRLVAFGSRGGEVILWDGQAGQAQLFAGPGTNQIHWLAFSRDGHYLAAADDATPPMLGKVDPRRIVRVWAVGAQKEPRILSTDGRFPKSLAFSADGKALMAGFWEGVKLWQLDRPGGGAATFLQDSWPVEGGVVLLPDGKTLISAGGTDLCFWDVRTRRRTSKLNPRSGMFSRIALSGYGRRLASGATDGRITIWDLASHQELATFEGHKYEVMQLAFTPDGDHLVSASRDQLRVWNAASWADFESAEKQARK